MNKINLPLDYSIQEIKKNLSILDVAEEFGLKLKRSGRSYFTLCPVHGEKTPSCSLVPDTDSTRDFSTALVVGLAEIK
ncbi:CHC2 zinc finger domain-containing protein [Neobacillus drentensis]|uniref:CHC2 zinc finger domain-containing protein n=1 Tax=Neobacillus drentensis TaxID=220684 RepID=UPI0030034A4B